MGWGGGRLQVGELHHPPPLQRVGGQNLLGGGGGWWGLESHGQHCSSGYNVELGPPSSLPVTSSGYHPAQPWGSSGPGEVGSTSELSRLLGRDMVSRKLRVDQGSAKRGNRPAEVLPGGAVEGSRRPFQEQLYLAPKPCWVRKQEI